VAKGTTAPAVRAAFLKNDRLELECVMCLNAFME
jgi:hypothetical protein